MGFSTEWLRSTIRSWLGYDAFLYRAASRLVSSLAILGREGLRTWLQIRRLGRVDPAPGVLEPLRLRNLAHPILVRPGTEDIGTIVNNVIREEYGRFPSSPAPLWMIDAGAYIGDTAAYFLSRYPGLHVVSLEPDPESFEIARRNLEPYGSRSMLRAEGLWGADEEIALSGTFTGTTVTDDGRRVAGVSVPTLLRRLGVERVDILKLDIEGAERSVFATQPARWLDQVDCLIVEFHGEDIEREALRVLGEAGFVARRFRSLIYFLRPGRSSAHDTGLSCRRIVT